MLCNHFLDLDKHADDIKDSGQHLAAMCLIETADSQFLSYLWNGLKNCTILVDSTNMYPKTVSKAYDALFKYKTPANITCISRNCKYVIFRQQRSVNQTSPSVAGINDVIHRGFMYYNCGRNVHYSVQFHLSDHCRNITQSL